MNSVIVTTYNGKKYIKQQLVSILNQTLQPDEVLIYDDNSTDNTVDIIKSFISDNNLNNWKLTVRENNVGWRRNFIDASEKASGKYIFFCDQDDVWMTRKLEIMSEIMENNKNILVLAGKYIKFYEDENAPEEDASYYNDKSVKKMPLGKKVLDTKYPGCVMCVRKDFFRTIIEKWNGIMSHDALCWHSARICGGAYLLNVPVIFWRRHRVSTYTIESNGMKSKNGRIEGLKKDRINLDCLRLIAVSKNSECSYLRKYESFLDKRISLLEKRKLSSAFKLIPKLGYYSRYRQYALDVYLSLKK